jgi:hypothetical protein
MSHFHIGCVPTGTLARGSGRAPCGEEIRALDHSSDRLDARRIQRNYAVARLVLAAADVDQFLREIDVAPAEVLDALLRAFIGAVDHDVVRQLARLPQARVEGLARLVRPLVARDRAIGFEEVAATVGEDHDTVVGVEGRPPNQPLVFEVSDALVRLSGVVAQRSQVVLGDHAE